MGAAFRLALTLSVIGMVLLAGQQLASAAAGAKLAFVFQLKFHI